jgi:two-component system cell cycle response regulator DivK
MSARTVLLVEDNEDNRTIYSTALAHAGFRVIEAATGQEGVDRARTDAPDLILMDMSMPVLDGWAATRILKGEVGTRHIPVVALTAHAMTTDRQIALDAGCDGYLAKPVPPRAVLAEVVRWLGAPAPDDVGETILPHSDAARAD